MVTVMAKKRDNGKNSSRCGGLCFRCEHRALYFESGRIHRPRHECGDVETSKFSCYMYQPVKPVVLAKMAGDRRPQFAGFMISARSKCVRIPDLMLDLKKYRDGALIYWVPMTPEEKKRRRAEDRKLRQTLKRWHKTMRRKHETE